MDLLKPDKFKLYNTSSLFRKILEKYPAWVLSFLEYSINDESFQDWKETIRLDYSVIRAISLSRLEGLSYIILYDQTDNWESAPVDVENRVTQLIVRRRNDLIKEDNPDGTITYSYEIDGKIYEIASENVIEICQHRDENNEPLAMADLILENFSQYSQAQANISLILRKFFTIIYKRHNLFPALNAQYLDTDDPISKLRSALLNVEASIGRGVLQIDQQSEINTLTPPLSGLKETMTIITEGLAAHSEIPYSILFGVGDMKISSALESRILYADMLTFSAFLKPILRRILVANGKETGINLAPIEVVLGFQNGSDS